MANYTLHRIDYHRKYSVLRTVDAVGTRVKGARLEHEDSEAFKNYFANRPEESRVVLKASWNWGWLYDQLGGAEQRGSALWFVVRSQMRAA